MPPLRPTAQPPDTRAHGFGRLPSPPDPRNYQLIRYLPDPSATRLWLPVRRAAKIWDLKVLLNQMDTPRCIGYGTTHYIDAEPIPHAFGSNYADAFYADCKAIDGFPDLDGSTVHAAAKVLRTRGLIKAYAWAKAIGEVREWLLTRGPMVAGLDWHRGMESPDARGYVEPTGPREGGHCFAILGWIPRSRWTILWDDVLCPNTWGPEWSWAWVNGKCYPGYFLIKAFHLASLMKAEGEVLAAVEAPPAQGDKG